MYGLFLGGVVFITIIFRVYSWVIYKNICKLGFKVSKKLFEGIVVCIT